MKIIINATCSDIYLAHYYGTTWKFIKGVLTGNVYEYFANLSSFSPFMIGSMTDSSQTFSDSSEHGRVISSYSDCVGQTSAATEQPTQT